MLKADDDTIYRRRLDCAQILVSVKTKSCIPLSTNVWFKDKEFAIFSFIEKERYIAPVPSLAVRSDLDSVTGLERSARLLSDEDNVKILAECA